MRIFFSLSILLFALGLFIFSCSKSIGPDPSSSDTLAKSCIYLTLTSAKGTDSQTVGLNVPITPITYKVSKYQSSDTTGLAEVSVSVIGLPRGVSTTYLGGVLTISGAAISDSSSPFVYIMEISGNACNLPFTGVISIKECGTISRTSPDSTSFQIIPSNTMITPITYKIGGGATGVTVTGLPPGITSSISGSIVTISGTLQYALDSTYKFKVITTGGYCSSYDSAFIAVTSCPTIVLTSPAGSISQTVTVNQTIVPVTFVVTGHYTGISLIGEFPPGITGVVNSNTITISGTPTSYIYVGEYGNFQYTIQVSTDVNSFCSPVQSGGYIQVN